MECRRFESYALGKMKRSEFLKHVRSCPSCLHRFQEDERLTALARGLGRESVPPDLWDKIETAILAEYEESRRNPVRTFWHHTHPVLRWAAVLILVFGLGRLLWQERSLNQNGLIPDSILTRVEKRERAYLRAIEQLEKRLPDRMAAMDMELSLLYRDRLETIDAQIRACQAALDDNPANGHIRRYMLAALQDKKQTLREIRTFRRKDST